MGNREVEKLVEEFVTSVVAQTDEIMKPGGSARRGNVHAKRRAAVFKELRAYGDAGREALSTLLTHPRMDVRVSAAVRLLRYKTAEAKAVLKEAAKGQGLVPFEAQEALKRWEDGTWALDPEEQPLASRRGREG